MDQDQKLCSFKEEIEGLKGLLAVSQKKCLEAEKKIKMAKESREGDHTVLDLEEENRRIEDQLKWKKEQFKHLEEAHGKLREQFKTSEKEWEMEKFGLLDEINSLQTSLDSQTRISEDLQKRLEMCHQALAHEESRRKRLEVQVSEFETRFENAFESQDAESEVAGQREDEIGSLRSSLGRKDMLCKEMEYQVQKLEQENQELLKSLKELHEAQIHESGPKSSTAKLRTKLKTMEQNYQNLRTKEAEWSSQLKEVKSELEGKDRAIEELMAKLELQPEESEQSSQMEKLRKDFNDCRSELECKDADMEKLKSELEGCNSVMMQLKMQNQDWSSQLENTRRDLNACMSELASKDRAIEELNLELEGCNSLMMQLKVQSQDWSSQLEDTKKDFNVCRSELASKDKAIEVLMVELEGCNSVMMQLKVQSQGWSSQLEDTRSDFNVCRSELASKNRAIEMLMVELEGCNSLMTQLKLQIQESEFQVEKMSKDFKDCRSESESKDRVIEELLMEMMDLMLQNEEVSVMLMLLKSGISEAQLNFVDKENEREALLMRIETLVHIEEQQLVMKKEIKRYKGMVAEMSSALERANSELVEKICEGNQMEFELQIWKSFAECLKVNLEEHYAVRKELEASLLAQIETEEIFKQEIDSLHKQIVVLDEELKTRQTEAASSESFDRRSFSNTTKENKIIEDLQKQIGLLEQEAIRRELEGAVLAQITAEKTFEQDKQKNQRIDDLVHQLAEKQAEINMVSEALENVTSTRVLAELEIEEKKVMIVELEDEIHNLQQKLEAKVLETRSLICEMEKKMGNSGSLIGELKREKQNLVDDITLLLSERKNFSCFLGEMDIKIGTLSAEDEQLKQRLGRIVQSFDTDAERIDEKENIITPLAKTVEVVTLEGRRSPFREVNNYGCYLEEKMS